MPTAVNIGTNQGGSVSTVGIAVPGGGVPGGSLIIVCVADGSSSQALSAVSDTKNTYTKLVNAFNNNITTNGFGAIFYAYGSQSLTNANTITYTLGQVSSSASISAFYVTGILASSDPAEASATATGTGTSPSVTSGTPSGTADFFVGCVSQGSLSGSGTFTQDSTHAAWATPPVRIANAAAAAIIAGGSVQGSGTSALTYAPTLNAASWAAMIAAFQLAPLPNESNWHQPWSEPVRFRPQLATAAQLAFFTVDNSPGTQNEASWHQPWSQPVQVPRRLVEGSQLFAPAQIIVPLFANPRLTLANSLMRVRTLGLGQPNPTGV